MTHGRLDLSRVCVALANQILRDPRVEPRMSKGVHAMNRRGEKAALDLMRPLGTGFDARKSVRDGVLDESIIAELEVKMRQLFVGTPIAPVEMRTLFEADGRGDDLLLLSRDDEDDPRPQSLVSELKKARLEVGIRSLAEAGETIEFPHREEILPADCIALEKFDLKAE